MSEDATAEYPPLQGSVRVVGTIVLSLATFMNVLDTTIANVSIPTIAGDLGVSPTQGTWVITSFGVANAIALPLTGWLSLRFGQVRLFVLSVLLFVAASWMCGLASSLQMLIVFRVVQGAVAGPMIPLSQTLLLQSYPKHMSGTALAFWAMTTLVAPVTGPIIGGWISDNLTWPWIFYINIPVGLGAAYLSWLIYRDRESPTRRLPVDFVGLGLLVIWVGSLQILLDKGRELDWFSSPQIVVLGIVALIGFCFFLVWELNDRHPIVDLSLFASRNFAVGTLSLALAYSVFFGAVVILPLWLQTQMGYTATWAGLAMAPVGILAMIFAPIIGRLLHRYDPRAFASAAFAVFALVSFLRAGFNTEMDVGSVILPQFIQGAGTATFFLPLTAVLLSGLPAHKLANASGLSNFARITAGAFGASVSTTYWDDRAQIHHARLVEHITAYSPATTHAVQALRDLGMSTQQAYGVLERTVSNQAYMLATNDYFLLSAWLFLGLIAVIWLTQPAHDGEVGAGGMH